MPAEPSSSREVYRGSLLRVAVERWDDREREVVRHPGAVAVVAVTRDGDVVLVRQFREAVRATLLELPAGIRDVEGEAREETARRELEEETGYRATTVVRLGTVHTSPGFADETVELYAAEVERRSEVSEPGVETERMPFREALAAVEDGRITDAKTVTGLLLARAAPLVQGLLGGP